MSKVPSKNIIKEAIQAELQKEGVFDAVTDPVAGAFNAAMDIPRGMAGSLKLSGVNSKIKRSTKRMKEDWTKTKKYADKKATKMMKSRNPSVAQQGTQVKQNVDSVDRAMITALNKMQDISNLGAQNPEAIKRVSGFEDWLKNKLGISPIRLSKGPGNEYGRFAGIYNQMLQAGIDPMTVDQSMIPDLMITFHGRSKEAFLQKAAELGLEVVGADQTKDAQLKPQDVKKAQTKAKNRARPDEGEGPAEDAEFYSNARQLLKDLKGEAPQKQTPQEAPAQEEAPQEESLGFQGMAEKFIQDKAIQVGIEQAKKRGLTGSELENFVKKSVPQVMKWLAGKPEWVRQQMEMKNARLQQKGQIDAKNRKAEQDQRLRSRGMFQRSADERAVSDMNRRNAAQQGRRSVDVDLPPQQTGPNIGDTQPIPLVRKSKPQKTKQMKLGQDIGSFSDYASDELGIEKKPVKKKRATKRTIKDEMDEVRAGFKQAKEEIDSQKAQASDPESVRFYDMQLAQLLKGRDDEIQRLRGQSKPKRVEKSINDEGEIQLGMAPSEDPDGVGQSATAPSEDNFGKKTGRKQKKAKRPSARKRK